MTTIEITGGVDGGGMPAPSRKASGEAAFAFLLNLVEGDIQVRTLYRDNGQFGDIDILFHMSNGLKGIAKDLADGDADREIALLGYLAMMFDRYKRAAETMNGRRMDIPGNTANYEGGIAHGKKE